MRGQSLRFLDFSPPAAPTLQQQRDALQKGLGRVPQWAAAGALTPEPLLEACLHDQRFDPQDEESRGEWLWNITSALGMTHLLQDPLLERLRSLDTGPCSSQLCELAMYFARSGDGRFRKWLYDSAEFAEEQLLRLDGEDAFLCIAQRRGRDLASREWEWDDRFDVGLAIEVIGEPRIQELLQETLDPDVRRFAASWLFHSSPTIEPDSVRPTHIQRMQAISVDTVLQAVSSDDKCRWLRGWGMHAEEQSLQKILHRLWSEDVPEVIVKLTRVFSNRVLPQFDSRWMNLAAHADVEVRRMAVDVLSQNPHPMIRKLALQQLQNNTFEFPAVSLLIKNYENGDEERLLHAVELPDDPCLRHWLLMDVIKLLEKNESADCFKLGQIAYFHTPCQNCRSYAAELLFARKCVPDWMIQECRTDAEVDCRNLCLPESRTDQEGSSL